MEDEFYEEIILYLECGKVPDRLIYKYNWKSKMSSFLFGETTDFGSYYREIVLEDEREPLKDGNQKPPAKWEEGKDVQKPGFTLVVIKKIVFQVCNEWI